VVDKVLLHQQIVGAATMPQGEALTVAREDIEQLERFVARPVPDRSLNPRHNVTPAAPR
jgi:hypothetical protein